MAVLLGRVVARVQDARAGDLEQEHARAEDVAGCERGEADRGGRRVGRREEDLLLEVERLDLVERGDHLGLGKEVVVGAGRPASASQGGKSALARPTSAEEGELTHETRTKSLMR